MSKGNYGIPRSILGAMMMLTLFLPVANNPQHAALGTNPQFEPGQQARSTQTEFTAETVSRPNPATQTGSVTELGWWRQSNATVITYDAVNSLVYLGAGGSVLIFDVSGGGDPQQIGTIETPAYIQDLAVAEGLLYIVSNGTGLSLFDVSTPASPQALGNLPYEEARDVEAANGYAYVAAGYDGLQIIDVSNPASPQEVNSIGGVDVRVTDVALNGQWVYIVFVRYNEFTQDDGYLYVFDVSNPAAPVTAGSYSQTGQLFSHLVVSGNYVYMLDRQGVPGGGLHILDISNANSIVQAAFVNFDPYIPVSVFVQDNLILLGGGGGQESFRILDASNIAAPVQVAGIMLFFRGFASGPGDVSAGGERAFLATGAGGLRVVSLTDPAHPIDIGGSDPTPGLTDLEAYGPYLYTATQDQTYIFSVDHPADPIKVGAFGPYNTSDVAISGDLAITINIYGMRLFSLANPLSPVEIGRYEAPNFAPLSVMIDGNIAYVRADPYGEPYPDLVVFDISDPTDPTVIGTWEGTEPLGIRQTVLYKQHLYVLDNGTGLIVIDVSTPSAPARTGTYNAECYLRGIAFSGDYAFVRDTHCDDENSYEKLVVLDISDPGTPVKAAELAFAAEFPLPGEFLTVLDDRLLITGSRTDVIDISNPLVPQSLEVINNAAGGEMITAGQCLYARGLGFTILQYGDRTCLTAPALLSPANHTQIETSFPAFDWEDVSSADHYEFQLSTAVGFSSPLVSENNVLASEYQPSVPAATGQRYYWRVRAVDASGNKSGWSIIRSVVSYTSLPQPAGPILVSPAVNALLGDYTPNLTWTKIVMPPGAIFGHYQIQLDEENTFSDPIVDWGVYNIDVTRYTVPVELTPNRTYYWRVQVYNDLEQPGPWSSVRTLRTQIATPGLISPAYAEHLQSTCYTFDWTAVDGASGYRIQMSQNPMTWSPLLLNVTSTSSSLSRCSLPTGGITLYWRVQANGLNGPSNWSNFIGFYAVRVPTLVSPANNVLVTNYSPLLDWNNIYVPNGGSAFKYYRVQTATDASFTTDLREYTTTEGDAGDSSLHPVPSLLPDKTYFWRVRAENVDGQHSAWSVSRYFRTAISPATLLEPADAALLANKRPTLKWDSVQGASSYTVEASLVQNFATKIFSATAYSTSYVHTVDLAPNTLYYWHVRANGKNGPSLYTITRSFTTGKPPSIPILSAPASNALTTDYSPLLDWGNVTLPAGTAFGHYRVQLAANAGFTADLLEFTTTETLLQESSLSPDLVADKKYYWRVRSENSDGQYSAWSAVRYFRTAFLPPNSLAPGDVIPVSAAPILNRRPVLSWETVIDATGYTVEYSLSPTFAIRTSIATTRTSYTPAADLLANKVYYWRVKATGTNGPSAPSQVRAFLTGNPPSTPVLSAPANGILLNSPIVRFDWGNSVIPVNTSFDHYQIQVATDSSFDPAFLVHDKDIPGIANSQDDGAVLLPGTTYFWRVRAWNTVNLTESHYSAWSTARSVRIKYMPPTLLSPATLATGVSRTPTFNWNDTAGVTGYTLQISLSPSFGTFVVNKNLTSSTYMQPTNLLANKIYYWRVRVNGLNGPSNWSPVFSFTTGS